MENCTGILFSSILPYSISDTMRGMRRKKEEIGSSDGSTEDDTSESEFTPCMPPMHPVGTTSDKSYNQSVLGVDSHVDLGCTTDFRKRFGF